MQYFCVAGCVVGMLINVGVLDCTGVFSKLLGVTFAEEGGLLSFVLDRGLSKSPTHNKAGYFPSSRGY